MYKHLLVATDGSRLSNKAVAHAISLAKRLGAKLTAFYAAPDYPAAPPAPSFSQGSADDFAVVDDNEDLPF